MILLKQMSTMFLMILVGLIAAKTKLLNDKLCKGLSGLIVNIIGPCMLLNSGFGQKRDDPKSLLLASGLAIFMYALLFVFAYLLPVILKTPKKEKPTYQVMIVFSNIGFMGLPIAGALYGNKAVLYAAIFNFFYNILIYTWGIQTLQKADPACNTEKASEPDSAEASGSGGGAKASGSGRRFTGLINPGTVSALAAITAYLLQIPLPGPVLSAVSSIAGMTAPLSMMVIGYSFSKMNLKSFLADRQLILFSLLRLILIPIAAVLILRLFVSDPVQIGTFYIMIATPVGSLTAMLAELYHGDFSLASRGVAFTTLVSVVTIPLVSMLLRIS